ncbi:MAG TPA: EscU/YscU/HrcU family type III secretion system export apparatus switch protein [Pirellulaceae bacterium]|nr:EscU/YscU/HrcU family type III secretion system export apparatus switch protein [Pirellulaceae bacterium]HMO92632.1 EscU/YscU/HrcU family type III secretion system export apparatus switch protein [Pirellulaceae bacterium]HMP70220.1 EscU/YscU/HrcU family type III secretion system export apparatus switch protein [Pirellulaceae bacterium]
MSREDAIHQPTPSRLQRARREGMLCRSQGVVWSGIWITFVSVLGWLSPIIVTRWQEYVRAAWHAPTALAGNPQTWPHISGLLQILLFFLLLICASTMVFNLMQGGFSFNPSRITPQFARLIPNRRRSALGLLTSGLVTCVKIISLLSLTGLFVYWKREAIVQLGTDSAQDTFLQVSTLLGTFCLQITVAIGAFAMLDYAVTRMEFLRSLKMTDQELRDEIRELQGDPRVHHLRSDLQREQATAIIHVDWQHITHLVVDGRLAVYAVEIKSVPNQTGGQNGVLHWNLRGPKSIQVIGIASSRDLSIKRDAELAAMLSQLKPGEAFEFHSGSSVHLNSTRHTHSS